MARVLIMTIMIKHGLKPGDRPDIDLYPEIWPQS